MKLVKKIDVENKIIYIDRELWEYIWKNLYTKKQPFKGFGDDTEKAFKASSLLYEFFIIADISDFIDDDTAKYTIDTDIFDLFKEGYKVVRDDDILLTPSNYKEKLNYKLEELMKIASENISKSEKCKEYNDSLKRDIDETYNNLKKFIR